MDLNNHIVKNDDNKPFHSNGMAQIAVGNRVGSVGSVSFNQRQQIDRERRLVYGYNRSVIGGAYGVLRANPVSTNNTNRIVANPSLQQYNSLSRTSLQRPNTPNHQSYNPFA